MSPKTMASFGQACAQAVVKESRGILLSAGEAPARTASEVRAAFGDDLGYILDAPTGGLQRPTPIRDAITGAQLRT